LSENLKDLETSDSKLKAQIEGLNRQLERSKRYAAPAAVTEEQLALEDEEEIDYDEHPLMQEHEAKYDEAIEEIGNAEYMKELRKLVTRFKREGLIDEDDVVEINERILDVEKTERLEEGMAALEDALNNQRDNQRDDVEERIREEVESRSSQSAVEPGDLPATGITPAIGKSKTRNQISEILKFGSPADMKDAIAEIEKPDDKVMNERANLQKQNRGCD
jgi:hypothetical protein